MGRDKRKELLYYASGGLFFEVLSLVKAGVDLDGKNSTGQTPSMLAAKESYRRTLELLINSGADIHCCDDNGWTALHYASSNECVEIVQCLVNKGVALDMKNSVGDTPLIIAARDECREVVELLINSGADIHCCDKDGWTLLHYAASRDMVEIVQYLINKGVALDLKNSSGETPLLLAAQWSRQVVELLINSGADIHCCDKDGWTILHLALTEGWLEIVQSLLFKGVDINIKASDGSTLLHLAIRLNRREIFDYLLKVGADCNLENNKGETPLNLLISRNCHVQTIKLCIKKGAYVKSADYNRMLKNPLMKKDILQDVKICSQAVINKFNNKDVLLLYKRLASSQSMPHVDKIKIGNRSGVVLAVEQAVSHEIKTNGYCNLLQMVPFGLSILCVKSLRPALNQENLSKSQNGLKRLGYYNEQEYPCKKICVKI